MSKWKNPSAELCRRTFDMISIKVIDKRASEPGVSPPKSIDPVTTTTSDAVSTSEWLNGVIGA